MPSKAKSMAISGVCGAIATLCLFCAGLPGTRWFVLILAVVASVAVAIPTMANGKVAYSILTYLASAIVGVCLSLANIVYVAPIVTFCMPMAIVKVAGETLKISTKVEQKTIDDPFGNGDDKQAVALQINAKPRMKGVVKWILYYVTLEVGIALTMLSTYLLMRPTFDFLVQNGLFVWAIVVAQLIPIPYDFLLRGGFALVSKALKRILK